MMDTPSIFEWDGTGVPPDGGDYRQVGERSQAHFHCEMCNREGNWSHVNAEGHLNNLKHYLCVTGQTHLLPSASPNGLTTQQPAPDGRFRVVPGPPPGQPPMNHESPPPPPPAAIPVSQQLLMVERKMDQKMEELATMLRALDTKFNSIMTAITTRMQATSSSTAPRSDASRPSWNADTAAASSSGSQNAVSIWSSPQGWDEHTAAASSSGRQNTPPSSWSSSRWDEHTAAASSWEPGWT